MVRPDAGTDQEEHPNKRRWGLIFILLPLLGVACLALLLLTQGGNRSLAREFVPVSLHSQIQADYSANPNVTRVPGVRLDIIWETIFDKRPGATDLEERQTALQNSLLTPVPTVTPSMLACEGLHFVYADQDSWIDSTNPTATHGTETFLQLGRDGNNVNRVLLHFSINDSIPQNTRIHSARLEMDVEQAVGVTPSTGLVFYNPGAPFGEVNTNWSNQPQPISQYQAGRLTEDNIHVWDVTSIVQDWLAGRSQNQGIILEPMVDANFTVVYYSREIVDRGDQLTNGFAAPVGPRMVINCGGDLPDAISVNLNTPTPTAVNIPPTQQATAPGATETPQPTVPVPTATSPPPPTPTVPPPSPEPTDEPVLPAPTAPPPTDTPVPPPPPPDDNGDGGEDGEDPPPASPTNADLVLSVNDSPDPVIAGDNLTYSFNIVNNGPNNASTVIFSDILPSGVSLISATASQGAGCSGTTNISCNLGSIVEGDNATVTIVVTVNSGTTGNLTNTGGVSSGTSDPVPANNSLVETTAVTTQADLKITKLDSSDPVIAGSLLTYTLTAKNSGPSDVTGVAITDTLPVSVTFNSASSGCTLSGGKVLCNGGTLTAGSSSAFTVAVTIDPSLANGTLISNTVSLSGNEPDPILGDNSATEPTTVNRMADLTITKSDTPDPVVAGQSLTYTLSITNNGPSDATGVTITDTLPAGVTFVSAAGCTPSGGKVICNIPGTLLPGDGAQRIIVVDVGSGTTGSLTNQAVVGGTEADTTPGNNTASITTTVNAVADLSLNKLVSNATPNVSSAVLFTVTVSNAGPSDATGVTVSDPLPSGYSFVSAAASLGSYGGGLWTVGTISATTNATLIITATVNATGIYTNYAQIQSADAADPNSTPGDNSTTEDDDATVTVNPIPVADLAISKSDNPDPVVAGQTLTYTLSITNNGPSDATGVTITDTLPSGVSFVSAGGCSEAGGIVSCSLGGLTAASSVQQTVVVTVDTATSGILTNQADVTGSETDPDSSNNNDTITTTVTTSADLAISKSDNPDPVVAGQTLTYTLSITNNGPSDATGVTITDTLSSAVTFASATGCSEAGGLVSCNIGGLTAGSSVQRTVVVTVNASTTGPFSNTVVVGGNETDPNTSNNTDTITTTVSTSADLAVTKSDTPDPVVAGQTLTYTVSITNNGPSDASGVVVTDMLPGGVTFSSAAGCSESGGVVTCSIGALAAGSRLQRTIVVTVNAATTGILTNQVDVTGFVVDPIAANNSDTITTTVTTSADLQISKSDSPDPVTAGTALTYTLTITNNGPSVAQNVVVTDTIPLSVTVMGTNPAFNSQSGQDWGWIIGSMSQGAVQTIVISVTVDSARTGVLINTGVVTGSTPDPNTGNNAAVVVTSVDAQTDLSVAKAASSILAYAGQPLTYTLTITNSGPSDATGVIITDTLSGAVDFSSAPGCSNAGSLVTCSVANLASGSSVQRTVVVTVNLLSAAPIINTVTVSGNETDPATGNNSDTITTPRNPYADLAISKRDSSDPVTVGSPLTYTLSITNNGPFDATNLTIADTLPLSVTLNSASPGCTESGGVVTCSVASLTAGANQQITIAVDVISTTAGLMTNTAEVLADTDDPNLGDNVATESTTIIPTVSINDVTVTEGDSGSTTATFSVSLSTASSLTATVAYVTGDNTATVADSDYNATGGTLTFSPGTTVQTFTVTINGDTVDELDEIYFVNLSSPTNATILDGLGVGAILDDDDPSLSISDVSITEGNSGSVSAVFTVTLSAVGVQTATVDYATANGTATTANSDYAVTSGSLTFPPSTTVQTLTVQVTGDTTFEGDETFFVTLTAPTNASLTDGFGIGTIVNDDSGSPCSAPAITLDATADTFIQENLPNTNEDTNTLLRIRPASPTQMHSLIQFDLSSIPANSMVSCAQLLIQETTSITGQTVHLHRVTTSWVSSQATWNESSSGNAWTTAGGDYDTTDVGSFSPNVVGLRTANLTSLAQYWYTNPGANYGLLLESNTVGPLGEAQFDSIESGIPPRLLVSYLPTLSINDVSVTEGNSGTIDAVFTVTLSSALTQTVTVDYTTTDNTATTANNDYVGKTGTLTFLPGVTQQTITVTVNGDTSHEANETFLINLSNPTNAGISDGQGVGTILNDELGGMLLGPGSGQIFLPLIIKSEPLILEAASSSASATE